MVRQTIGAGWLAVGTLLAPAGTTAQAPPDAGGIVKLSRLQGSAALGRNRGVVGATVLVTPDGEGSRLFVTATDLNGRFRVEDLPDGDYRVEIRREGLSTVVKEGVEVRFPTRSVVEVTMEPAAEPPAATPAVVRQIESTSGVRLRGTLIERGGGPMPDAVMRFVRVDGAADPVVVRSGEEGAFELPPLPEGPWRLEAHVVGFLPIRAVLDLAGDTAVSVTMVPQPAGYKPSPLELMPPEQVLPPQHALAPPPATRPDDESGEAAAEEPADEPVDPEAPADS